MIFFPTVQMGSGEDNIGIGLTNFDAVNFVEYEIFRHYSKDTQATLDQYRQVTPYVVKSLTDDEYIVVER